MGSKSDGRAISRSTFARIVVPGSGHLNTIWFPLEKLRFWDRLYHIVLGLLCISISVREVDIDRLGGAGFTERLEHCLRLGLIIAWWIPAYSLFRHRFSLWSGRFDLVLSPCSRLSIIAIICYGLPWFPSRSGCRCPWSCGSSTIEQDGNQAGADEVGGGAAEDQLADAGVAVSSHDQQVDLALADLAGDHVVRVAGE